MNEENIHGIAKQSLQHMPHRDRVPSNPFTHRNRWSICKRVHFALLSKFTPIQSRTQKRGSREFNWAKMECIQQVMDIRQGKTETLGCTSNRDRLTSSPPRNHMDHTPESQSNLAECPSPAEYMPFLS